MKVPISLRGWKCYSISNGSVCKFGRCLSCLIFYRLYWGISVLCIFAFLSKSVTCVKSEEFYSTRKCTICSWRQYTPGNQPLWSTVQSPPSYNHWCCHTYFFLSVFYLCFWVQMLWANYLCHPHPHVNSATFAVHGSGAWGVWFTR